MDEDANTSRRSDAPSVAEVEGLRASQGEGMAPNDGAAKEPILRFFEYAHLPMNLQEVSRNFRYMAYDLLNLPRSAERTVALRKLLESKDAAVRAALP